MVVASTGGPIPKTNFFVKDASGNFVDIINLYDTSAPGTQTTNFITNGDSFTNKDLGKIFTPYVFGANSINFFTGATTDLGSKFAQIGKTSKYILTGTYTITSNSTYNTIITFTSNTARLTFIIAPTDVNVLLVAGGGGAVNTGGGGGGGVGIGVITNVPAGNNKNINIIIGNGGAYADPPTNGGNSTISIDSNVIETAYGGGAGGIVYSRYDQNDDFSYTLVYKNENAKNGGSSGGGGVDLGPLKLTANPGTQPTKGTGTYLTYYGNSGGVGLVANGIARCGGGGGADGVGGNASFGSDGARGAGKIFTPTGLRYGAGGGTNGTNNGSANTGNGGNMGRGGSGVCVFAFNI